jgi:pyruvate dehydrogenase E1 component alpha subunit
MTRDPVQRYRQRLASLGIDEDVLRKIDEEARRKVDLATEEARNAPPARVEDIESQLWSDGGSAWRN